MGRGNVWTNNRCGSCGYTWTPRGHIASRACPSCRSTNVVVPSIEAYRGLRALSFGVIALYGCLVVVALVVSALKGVDTGKIKAFGIVSALVAIGLFALVKYLKHRNAVQHAAAQEAERRRAWELEQQRLASDQALRQQQEAARWQHLVGRFGEENARRIVARDLWVGASEEMVIDMFGPPNDVSEKVLKTKTKRVLRYDSIGGPRGLKVKLDDGIVAGWDK